MTTKQRLSDAWAYGSKWGDLLRTEKWTMRKTTKCSGEKILKETSRTRPASNIHLKMKNRIVLDGMRGEDSIAELCRREGKSNENYGPSALNPI